MSKRFDDFAQAMALTRDAIELLHKAQSLISPHGKNNPDIEELETVLSTARGKASYVVDQLYQETSG